MAIFETEHAGIRVDQSDPNIIRGYFESRYTAQIYDPIRDPFESESLLMQVENWQAERKVVVFTSGAFDVMHANHRTYLMHAKLAAAQVRWERGQRGFEDLYKGWDDLPPSEQEMFTRLSLAQDNIKLVVSVDGNDALAQRKGHKPEKGNIPRPIYDWETRARDVMSVGYELNQGEFRPVVDAVTIHDNVHSELAGTPHGGILEIGEYLRPDVWAVYEESEDVLTALQTTHNGLLATGMRAVVLPSMSFYRDRLLDDSFSTTALTRRIGSAALDPSKL